MRFIQQTFYVDAAQRVLGILADGGKRHHRGFDHRPARPGAQRTQVF